MPLINGLYPSFGSPVPGGQKPQEREDVTAWGLGLKVET